RADRIGAERRGVPLPGRAAARGAGLAGWLELRPQPAGRVLVLVGCLVLSLVLIGDFLLVRAWRAARACCALVHRCLAFVGRRVWRPADVPVTNSDRQRDILLAGGGPSAPASDPFLGAPPGEDKDIPIRHHEEAPPAA